MYRRTATNVTSIVHRFCTARNGSLLVKFAVLTPMILVATLSTVDYAMALRQKSKLQGYIDVAAIAAAKELSLSITKKDSIPDIVSAIVGNLITESGENFPVPTLDTVVSNDPLQVSITARQTLENNLAKPFGVEFEQIGVRSVARVVGSPNICVLGLEAKSAKAIALQSDARVTGRNCAVFSNSTDPQGIHSKDNAQLKAKLICSAGGSVGGKANFEPAPVVDCPQFTDPLASRPPPPVSGCDYNAMTIEDETRTIYPGTYCGGLEISGTSRVKLRPGIYVIASGDLVVKDDAEFTGEKVGLYLAGASSSLTFADSTTIEIAAPTNGIMAGLLIFSSRNQNGNIKNTIMSNNARILVGTIYMPQARFTIDGDSPIAGESAYTAIVARRIEAGSKPNLVLNTNYDETDVPVPSGIRGAGQPVALVE